MKLRVFRSVLSTVFIFVSVLGAASVACVCEALSFLLVRPFSLTRHRRICLHFTHAFFLVAPFLLEKWSSITFRSYGHAISPKGSYLAVVNHHSDVDWLLGLAFVSHFRYPYPGNAKSVVKASLAKVPIFGHILQNAEFLFITRSWANDRDLFIRSLKSLRGYSKTVSPLWFVLYPEGTRLTPEKLLHSQEYAESCGLKAPENVLFPRFKAFVSIMSNLRDEFDGILDATFMFEGNLPSMKSTLAGSDSTIIHTHQHFYPMSEIPEGKAELEAWLLKRWYEKDTRLAEFKRDPTTLGPQHDSCFPAGETPSLIPFYSLVAVFFLSSAITTYIFSRIPNGLSLLAIAAVLTVGLAALFMLLNIKPSRKGSSHGHKDPSQSRLPQMKAGS
ncbi:1-acyl-sn-glycerol-3-phosphate acyltransferase PLS1 [Gracilariopsis chorda]|uniref:1-acyl-sn-glycerol-3-phosphate acyltransferase PLS1 n=1 Tax=Gracilariopsis chorda TaxID=448386 RepID=A0A2V3IW66_9FLOR|nr:1-acyl-sn-glycerol-3-phosphate acyltransferase PLS1 [Gracilariopsis chorda]|eukprot:PXF46313.1 1-acyl-sn-glycerol-3-phosphate acyltransferase PLS1 [Gracilariopsis chorda]